MKKIADEPGKKQPADVEKEIEDALAELRKAADAETDALVKKETRELIDQVEDAYKKRRKPVNRTKGKKVPEKSGAGGSWPTIDEAVDPSVIRQLTSNACGPASGTMLLKSKGVDVFQSNTAALKGEVLSDAPTLAKAMNQLMPKVGVAGRWVGTSIKPTAANLERLVKGGSFAATLKGPGTPLHMVVVDGVDAIGKVVVRDPYRGTRYLMNAADFLDHWTPQTVYWKGQ